MFNKVLIATDGSNESIEAAKMANKMIKENLIKELFILNIEPTFVNGAIDMGVTVSNIEGWNSMAQEYGETLIEEADKVIEKTDIKITRKVIMGDPAATICEYAEAKDCDLIIMGSRGKNPLSGLLLGSVSTRVLHFAKCPVLVVKSVKN